MALTHIQRQVLCLLADLRRADGGVARGQSIARRRSVLDVVGAAGLFAVAAAARTVVAVVVPETSPVADMAEYWERALHIASTGTLYDNSWRMPGYPLALALAFKTGVGTTLAARGLNVIAGALAALLTYWLARRATGPKPAFVAGLIVALYPSFLLYTVFVATETIVTVPILATLIAVTYRTPRAAVVAGLCVGLTVLIRPAGIALLPAVLIATAWRYGDDDGVRWSWRRPALALLVFVLVMTPWWLHNARLHGRFVLLDTTSGLNLLIGNSPYATGQWSWSIITQLYAEPLSGIDVTTPAGADHAASLAVAHLRAHPFDVIRLLPAKIAALLAAEGREHAYLYSIGYFGTQESRVVWLWGTAIVAAFPLLFVAATAGTVWQRDPSWRVALPCILLLIGSASLHAISFGDPRFHLPFVPVLAVLATGLASTHATWPRWRLAAAALLLLFLSVGWARQAGIYGASLAVLASPGGSSIDLKMPDLP